MTAVSATDATIAAAAPDRSLPLSPSLPPSILGYVWRFSWRHQIALAALSVVVFLLTMVPLELQRRIINDALKQGALQPIVLMCLAYVGVALAFGLLKFGMNVYRGWLSETAVRHLREEVYRRAIVPHARGLEDTEQEGTSLAIVLGEVEPVGSFVGISISEPLLQIGILVTVFGYMVFLQPWIALVSLILFLPQLILVPMLQARINVRAGTRIQTMRKLSGEVVGGWWKRYTAARRRAYQDRIDSVFTLNMQIWGLKFAMNFGMNFLHHLGTIGVLLIGGWYVVQGEAEIGTVVAFLSGLAKIKDPWGDLVNYFREATVAQVKYALIVDTCAVEEGAVAAD